MLKSRVYTGVMGIAISALLYTGSHAQAGIAANLKVLLPTAPGAVLLISNDNINGRNVTTVFYNGGMFEQNGNRWVERNNDGTHNFEETGRDDWSVYLVDRGRNMRLQIDLHRKEVLFAVGNSAMQPLYRILRVGGVGGIVSQNPPSTDSGGIVSQNPPTANVIEYSCNEGTPLIVRFENSGARSTAYFSHDSLPEIRLDQVVSGSGTRYSNGRYTLSTKGSTAVLEWNGTQDFCRAN